MIDCICVRKNPVIFEIKKNFYNMETKQSLLTLTKELKFIPVIPFMRGSRLVCSKQDCGERLASDPTYDHVNTQKSEWRWKLVTLLS